MVKINLMMGKKMQKMPRGAKLIYNPSSAAPGFILKTYYHFQACPQY